MYKHTLPLWLCLWIGTIACSTLQAQNWPQWRGVHRDGKAEGFTAPATWPEALTQKWKVEVGPGDATPALVDNKLYCFIRQGDQEVILCLNAMDGTKIWSHPYAAPPVTGPAARHPGPRSSLVVMDDSIVTLGASGILTCLDLTGKERWHKDPFPGVVPRFFTSSSPIIVDGRAIAYLGGAGNGALIAYDLTSGDEKWRWAQEGPDYASLALLTIDDTKQIVTLTEKSIVGVNCADGKLLWQRPFAPAGRSYNAATPIIAGSTVIYTGAGRGTTAINIQKQDDGFVTQEVWTNPDVDTQYNTPVLENGLLFGLNRTGKLFCLNAQNGKTAWIDDTQRGSGGFGTIVDAGSCLMALPNNGELTVYQPNGSQFSLIKTYKIADSETYGYPVLSGNRLWIKDQDSVALWVIPS